MKTLPFSFKYLLPPGLRQLSSERLRQLSVEQGAPIELYPLLPIRLYTESNRTPVIEGLLDSGSHGLFIPKRIAATLNLTLFGKAQSTGVDGPYDAHFAKVGLIIGRGGRTVNFGYVDAVVPDEEKDVPILIGRHPVFDKYQVIFEEYIGRLRLIPKEDAQAKSSKQEIG